MKFIHCADLHLRTHLPICRKESDTEWIDTQTRQLSFISEQAYERDCGIAIAGDIFHKSTVPDIMKNLFLDIFGGQYVGIMPGQHDLPNHNYNEIDKSSFGVLWLSGKFQSVTAFGDYVPFGEEEIVKRNNFNGILFLHQLVFEKEVPYFMEANSAQEILDKYPNYKYILCGDNHHGFHYKNKGRHLIMAGCMNRQDASFVDYEPCIWFIDTKEDVVERIPVPDDVNMVSDVHIKQKKEKDSKLIAITELIQNKGEVGIDFEHNVREALKSSEIESGVKKVTNELMEE